MLARILLAVVLAASTFTFSVSSPRSRQLRVNVIVRSDIIAFRVDAISDDYATSSIIETRAGQSGYVAEFREVPAGEYQVSVTGATTGGRIERLAPRSIFVR